MCVTAVPEGMILSEFIFLGIVGLKLGLTANGAVLQRAGTHDGEVHWNLTLPGKERGETSFDLHFFWATFEYSLMSVNTRIFDIKIIIVIIDIIIKARAACCKVLCMSCSGTTPLLKPFSLAFVDVIYHLQHQCNR